MALASSAAAAAPTTLSLFMRSCPVRCTLTSPRFQRPPTLSSSLPPIFKQGIHTSCRPICTPQALQKPAVPSSLLRQNLPLSTLLASTRLFHSSVFSRRPEVTTTSVPVSPKDPSSSNAAQPVAPSAPSSTNVQEPTARAVGYHSIFLALLVYAIILVGGLTRLTESGLSITEWNPGFKGMWLPSTDEEWLGEWAKYRETPEFHLLNSKMDLSDFKSIYMWEWSHRIIGRFIGVAYVLPAIYFVARGYVKPPFRSKLFLIGLGIGAQGAMGWYMVKSGLVSPEGTLHVDTNDEPHSAALAPPPAATPASWTPRVSHFRLAAHLGLAFLVYAGMLRTGLSVLREYNLAKNVGRASGFATGPGVRERLISILSHPQVARYRGAVAGVTGLVFLTAMSGAFVAGLDAGLVYNEFPTMGDGRIAPPLKEMFDERYARSTSGRGGPSDDSSQSSMILHNLTQNPVTVQFIHRCLAVTTFAVVAGLAWRTHRLNSVLKATGAAPLPPAVPRLANAAVAAVTLQATLGISTLIYMVPIELASAHQAGSVLLLSVMLALWGSLRVPSTPGMVGMTKQAANVAAAVSGSATAASAAGGAPGMARGFHTARAVLAQQQPPPQGQRRGPLGSLDHLPDKVMLKTGPAGRLSKVLPARESHEITTRVGSSYGGNHSLQWLEPPRNVLIVTKQRLDDQTRDAVRAVIEHINAAYPQMNVVLEEKTASSCGDLSSFSNLTTLSTKSTSTRVSLSSKIDFVVTLGGDGTILHASSLFDRSAVPPVLSFSMGTLGFLLPWNIDHFKAAMDSLVNSTTGAQDDNDDDGGVTLLLRMRLRSTIHEKDGRQTGEEIHLMNEVALHRGREPHMTTIDAFVDGRHLTRAISDGLIVASPTGSTAYSLSAGGPIVHPSVQSLLLTPICPRSLSFRPLILPSDSTIQLKISPTSRSPAEVTIDGRGTGNEIFILKPGQYLQISMSPYPIPCVNRPQQQHHSQQHQQQQAVTSATTSDRGEDDWTRDINRLLRFNASFTERGMVQSVEEADGEEEAEPTLLG